MGARLPEPGQQPPMPQEQAGGGSAELVANVAKGLEAVSQMVGNQFGEEAGQAIAQLQQQFQQIMTQVAQQGGQQGGQPQQAPAQQAAAGQGQGAVPAGHQSV